MYESKDKMVSHPDHYQSESGLEVIDVIKAFTADLKGIEATDTGNIIKYACRWKRKNGVQDLEKIIWYAQHLIDELKAKAKANGRLVTREEAENFLIACTNILEEYGCLTMADVKHLRGVDSVTEEDNVNGWTNLGNTLIRKDEYGYYIIFPETTQLITKETE